MIHFREVCPFSLTYLCFNREKGKKSDTAYLRLIKNIDCIVVIRLWNVIFRERSALLNSNDTTLNHKTRLPLTVGRLRINLSTLNKINLIKQK